MGGVLHDLSEEQGLEEGLEQALLYPSSSLLLDPLAFFLRDLIWMPDLPGILIGIAAI